MIACVTLFCRNSHFHLYLVIIFLRSVLSVKAEIEVLYISYKASISITHINNLFKLIIYKSISDVINFEKLYQDSWYPKNL